jgi:hypothetical protein
MPAALTDGELQAVLQRYLTLLQSHPTQDFETGFNLNHNAKRLFATPQEGLNR